MVCSLDGIKNQLTTKYLRSVFIIMLFICAINPFLVICQYAEKCSTYYFIFFSRLLLLLISLYLRWPPNKKIQKYKNCTKIIDSNANHFTQHTSHIHRNMAAQFVIRIFETESCVLYSHVRGSSKSPMCRQIKYSTTFRHLLDFFFFLFLFFPNSLRLSII